MLKHYIEKYIKNMSINDVYNFAEKNNVKLNNEEANIIYSSIKDDWEILVFGDYKIILNKYKDKLSKSLIIEIEKLIVNYKEKYSQLLN